MLGIVTLVFMGILLVLVFHNAWLYDKSLQHIHIEKTAIEAKTLDIKNRLLEISLR